MTKTTILAGVLLVSRVCLAGAQQAAIPKPHPLPQPTTECRGCSDNAADTKSSVGKYDEKKEGTVSPTVRPEARLAKVTPKKTVAKKHKHKTVKKPAVRKSLTPPAKPTVLKAKPDTVKK